MKTEDLMIGDWVDFYHPHEPEKKIVTRHRITEIFECGLVGISNHPNPVHADHIEPVKITPEILEKNDFVQNTKDSIFEHIGCGIIYGKYYRRTEGKALDTGDCLYPIKYVHQLQHALKLCGINKEIKL